MLETLLRRLAQLYGKDPSIRVVVVDNDRDGSAAEPARSFASRFAGGLEYLIEPRQGYSHARNAALCAAQGSPELAFIDDDEVPEDGWLEALRAAMQQFGAHVVAGPVRTVYPTRTPPWMLASKVFDMEQPDLQSGAEMRWCATNNCLISHHVLGFLADGFDVQFNASGGEDTNFFFRAHLAGYRIVWCRDAVVRETVGDERLRIRWILQRARRNGNTRAYVELDLAGGFKTATTRLIKAALLTGRGAGRTVIGAVLFRRATLLRGLHDVATSAGMYWALLGRQLL